MSKKNIIPIFIFVVVLAASAAVFVLIPRRLAEVSPVPVFCAMDAKICPDGNAVGRQGPSCEFAPCPTATLPDAIVSNGNLTLAVGQKGNVNGLIITLNAFVQDSRCPIDVVCIQAGAVTVNVTLTDATHSEMKNFPSDEVPQKFGKYRVSIADIATPRQNQKEVLEGQYRITFHVTDDTGLQ